MKRTLLVVVLALAFSIPALAEVYNCTPARDNSYFTDNLSLTVDNNSSIELNNVKLKLDPKFNPRTLKDFVRYTGDTEIATGWSDSGVVQVLLGTNIAAANGAAKGKLKIRVSGETFIEENFSCAK